MYLLLEVSTRVILLYDSLTHNGGSGAPSNSFGGNDVSSNSFGGNDVSSNSFGGKDIPSIADDSLLVGILERAPKGSSAEEGEMYYTSTGIIEKCLQLAGEVGRTKLAEFFPYYCLLDRSVEVRRSALAAIGKYPELVKKYYRDVLSRW